MTVYFGDLKLRPWLTLSVDMFMLAWFLWLYFLTCMFSDTVVSKALKDTLTAFLVLRHLSVQSTVSHQLTQ